MNIGDIAPDFEATTHTGETFRLHDFCGKQNVVLFFYPQDGTPICTREVCSFRDAYEQFLDADTVLIGISRNNQQSHEDLANKLQLPFYLVSDSNGTLRELYEVPRTLGIVPGRVTYVIDRGGLIRHIFNSQLQPQQHVIEALKTVQMLQEV